MDFIKTSIELTSPTYGMQDFSNQEVNLPMNSLSSPSSQSSLSPIYYQWNQSDEVCVISDERYHRETMHNYGENCEQINSCQIELTRDGANTPEESESVTSSINDEYSRQPAERTRIRQEFNKTQVDILQNYYRHSRYLKRDEQDELANILKVDGKRLTRWFRNRRQKDKMLLQSRENKQPTSPLSEPSPFVSTNEPSPVYCYPNQIDQTSIIMAVKKHVQENVENDKKSDPHHIDPTCDDTDALGKAKAIAPTIENDKNPRTQKRKRRDFNENEKEVLENFYRHAKYIKRSERDQLANALGVDGRSICVWFQNRRQKEKRPITSLILESSSFASTTSSPVYDQSMQIEQFNAGNDEQIYQNVKDLPKRDQQLKFQSTNIVEQMIFELPTYSNQEALPIPGNTHFTNNSSTHYNELKINSNPYISQEFVHGPNIPSSHEQSVLDILGTFNCLDEADEDLTKILFDEYFNKDRENDTNELFNVFQCWPDIDAGKELASSSMIDLQ